MTHYDDILLLPDPEFPATVLMNAVFAKLHKALHDSGSSTIGVSFPHSNRTLGDVLRLHGSDSDLQQLRQRHWLGGMSGYCQFSAIRPVPDDAKHRKVSRRQANMSQAKLKRLQRRGSISDGEAEQYRIKMASQRLTGPYLELQSVSNGQKHRRYLEFGPLQDDPIRGEFDHFGLSRGGTVPWF